MKTIGIAARSFSPGWKTLFDALGEAFGVSFEERVFGDDQDVDGWVVLAADRSRASEVCRIRRPCYVVLDDAELIPRGTSSTITCGSRPEVPPVLRGREIAADDVAGAGGLPHWLPGVVPLAFKEGAAVWAIDEHGMCRHHYVSLPPPALNAGAELFTHFSGRRIACLLPLVLFVRSLTEDHGWEPPPLQATFMFDDPNLHWTSYGFIDFGKMVRRAGAGNYHVSVATIPLDAWFVHSSASALFRENTSRMSLLYHGNDHVYRELARSQSPDALQILLRQALGRIARLEARTGLEVARVMAPPHGACSQDAMSEMARLGFEAVCVSHGSLCHHNDGAAWRRAIGMRPCDMVAGLPVIPRFGLSRDCRNDILVAAVLHQPIVPMTHHQAVADGYDLLDDVSSFVNSLGDVSWRDMKTISRSLYSRRQEGRSLRVRMWSRRISICVPPGTTEIHVEPPRPQDSAGDTLWWRTTRGNGGWKASSHQESIAVRPGALIEVTSSRVGAAGIEALGNGPRRLAPVARRLLTEIRDRALPSVHYLVRAPRRATPAFAGDEQERQCFTSKNR